jgi:hypothetical protein
VVMIVRVVVIVRFVVGRHQTFSPSAASQFS